MDSHVAEVAETVGKLIQGQVLNFDRFPLLVAMDKRVGDYEITQSASTGRRAVAVQLGDGCSIVVTQTCDLQKRHTLRGRSTVHLAPLLHVDEGAAITRQSVAQESPRYVHVPWHEAPPGKTAVADLDFVGPVDRGLITEDHITQEKPTGAQVRVLAHALGRPWSRAALDDDVDRVVAPVKKKLRDAKNEDLRRLFDDGIFQVRVGVSGEANNLSVKVLLVPYQEWYPDVEVQDSNFRSGRPGDHTKIAKEICELYDRHDPGPESSRELVQSWMLFAKWLTDVCVAAMKTEAASRRSSMEAADGGSGDDEPFTVTEVEVSIGMLDSDVVQETDLLDLSHLSIEE